MIAPSLSPESPIVANPRIHTTRRRILRLLFGTGIGGTALALRARHNANTVDFRREDIQVNIPELEGLRLLFLTDPHIGGNINSVVYEVVKGIDMLLDGASRSNTIVLHGADFVSRRTRLADETSMNDIRTILPELLHGLDKFPNFSVVGNHDAAHSRYLHLIRHLSDKHSIQWLQTPDDQKQYTYNGKNIAIHGIHTLSKYLSLMVPSERNALMDEYIYALNNSDQDMNICLLHNPDGLQFLLDRLVQKQQKINKPTLFLAGHTHGGMIDIPGICNISLKQCHTLFNRYKGWYAPEGNYADTGDWKLFVSTGVGNSPCLGYRLNADPEVVCFEFKN